MTEDSAVLSAGIRWGSRLAALGIVIAVLSVVLSAVGVGGIDPLYWVAMLLAIVGVLGAAVRGAQSSTVRYPGGIISTMAGILVLGYGIESGHLLAVLVGVVLFVAGVVGVVVDTRRME